MDLRSSALLCSLGFAALMAMGPQAKRPAPTPAKAAEPTFAKHFSPVITKVCLRCHSGKSAAGGADFSILKTEPKAVAQKALLQKIAKNVASGAMPPQGLPAASKRQFLAYIDRALAGDCDVADAGRVTIRRLNRAEYDNTIRDLLDVQHTASEDFPSDDVGYGFDNIGDVLSVSPLLMEKYLRAAETISQRAIVVPGSDVSRYDGSRLKPTTGANSVDANDWLLYTNGDLSVQHTFPRDGEYRLRVRAYGHQAGGAPVLMTALLGGKEVGRFDVAATVASPQVYEFPIRALRGTRRLAVAFANDFFDANLPEGKRDRNLIVSYVEVVGPLDAGPLPGSHLRLIPSVPPKEKKFETARLYLSRFASRAYRRPVKPEELDRLVTLFKRVDAQGEPFERAMQVCVQAVLVSPHFLFRVEQDPVGSKGTRTLSGWELASRLSYFLWSSMPDDTLFALARDGSLVKPAVLKAQVARMLKDPRAADALCQNFASQWLQLRKLEIVHPDPKEYAGFSDSLKRSMRGETESFFRHVVTADKPITDFLDARYSFVNEELARHYGLQGVTGPELRQVSLQGTNRAGLLTQAAVLTVTSNPTRTSPVKRGKWVLEQILGSPPPPPPPGVGDLQEGKEALTAASLRERLEEHRKDPMCASCHSRMDPIGFGLENFDGVGAWREADGPHKIDATGVLPGGKRFAGPLELVAILKGRKDEFAHNLADKMLTYATGRGMTPSDECHLDTIAAATKAGGYRFSALVAAVATSEPFRMKRQ